MAAVTLTKVDTGPTGTLGATRFASQEPNVAWYTAGTISNNDTITFNAWTGPTLQNVFVKPVVSGESVDGEWAITSGNMVITLKGSATAGAFVGIAR